MLIVDLLSVLFKPASELTGGLLQSTICRDAFVSDERMAGLTKRMELAIKEVLNVGGTYILSGLHHW